MSAQGFSTAGLTLRQGNLLAFIAERCAAGLSPSFEEMRAHLGLSSKSGVIRLVEALEERGRIRRPKKGQARGIKVIPDDPFYGVSTAALAAELQRRGVAQ